MSDQELSRSLRFKETFSLVIGTVIGTGVFLKAAVMTQETGSAAWVMLAWIAAGLLSLTGAFCYAELGSRIPKAGGEYIFLREAFGGLPAFLNGWMRFWIGNPGSIASYAVGLMTFLSGALPMSEARLKMWAVIVIVVFTGLNCLTVRAAGLVQAYMTALKLSLIAGLTILIFANLPAPHGGGDVFLGAWPGWKAFGAAMLGALWAYDGWNGMPMAAGEIHEPGKNIPRALVAGMVSVMLIYLVMNAAYFASLPLSEITSSHSPEYPTALPVASKAVLFTAGAGVLALVSVIMAFSALVSLNGSVLTGARVPFAMARHGLLWEPLGRVNATTHAPVISVVVQGLIAVALACSGSFDQLTDYVMFASWIFYALTAAALFRLRRRGGEAVFEMPGYPWVALVFILVSVWLVLNTIMTSPKESLIGVLFIVAGVPFYYWRRRKT